MKQPGQGPNSLRANHLKMKVNQFIVLPNYVIWEQFSGSTAIAFSYFRNWFSTNTSALFMDGCASETKIGCSDTQETLEMINS
jgi:hypothetical protein